MFQQLYNLETLLLQGPSKSTNLATNSRVLSQLLSQKLVPTKEPNPIKRCYRRLAYFVEDNWKRIWVMGLWISICVGLFTWKFIQYRHRAVYHVMGYCVTTAKGAAETLKFNMALILLPVCRNTITWLRSTKLGVVVPFDDNINFHKVCHNLELEAMSIECRSILPSQIMRETKLCSKFEFCQTVFTRDLILELSSICFLLGMCSRNRHWCRSSCNFTSYVRLPSAATCYRRRV